MTTGGFPDATVIAFRRDLLAKHNALRAHYGKPALTINTTVQNGAQAWANYMASHNYYGHGGNYPNPGGQNIAKGQRTVMSVMYGPTDSWRTSCGHFYTMIYKGYTKVGFGIARSSSDTYYWAAHFGGSSTAGICSKCPGCTCSSCGSGCTTCKTSGHAFYSNDCNRPGGSCYWP